MLMLNGNDIDVPQFVNESNDEPKFQIPCTKSLSGVARQASTFCAYSDPCGSYK